MNVQIIEKNGRPEWAIIPFSDYQKMQEALEDAEDIKEIEKSLNNVQEGIENGVPGEVTFAILEGVNPIRAWRQYKNMKMNAMAKKIRISPAYLSQIENGKRNPTVDTLKAIAHDLAVDIDMLL